MTQQGHTPAQRAQALLAQMTLEEKAAQMLQLPVSYMTDAEAEAWARRGIGSFLHTLGDRAAELQAIAAQSRLGVPILFGIDAVRGHALKNGATVFPPPLAMASTWDPELLGAIGRVTAAEVAADGLHWTFSPLLCVARDLRWGRVDETFGESPMLIGELAAAMIRGYQGASLADEGSILACAKHYLAYGESIGGRDSVDAPIPMRLVREVFLPPFAKAAQAGCATFMTAYHAIDGVPLSIHHELLTRVLKEELGLEGFVVTDWDNVRSLVTRQHVAADLREATCMAIAAGNDMVMSTEEAYAQMVAAVREGTLPETRLDDAVRRILTLKFRLGLFDHKRGQKPQPKAIGTAAHRAVNARVGEESLVLLKNEGALPLAGKRIAVVGPAADSPNVLLGDWTYLTHPGAHPFAEHAQPVVTPLAGLRAAAAANGLNVTHARGCGILNLADQVDFPHTNNALYDAPFASYIQSERAPLDMPAVLEACEGADAIVACVGDMVAQFGEGRDRANLALSGDQLALLKALRSFGKPLVVVLLTSKPLTVPWVARHADAVVQAFGGGQTLGDALAKLLLGELNPSGRLPISYAHHVGQLPVYHNQLPGWHDGHYTDLPAEPLYPCGFGLSYTAFRYGQATLARTQDGCTVSVPLSNTGARAGTAVAQIYAHRPAHGRLTPVKELVAFQRVALAAGETRTLHISVAEDALRSVLDDGTRVLVPGEYTLMVGDSSRDADLQRLTLLV